MIRMMYPILSYDVPYIVRKPIVQKPPASIGFLVITTLKHLKSIVFKLL